MHRTPQRLTTTHNIMAENNDKLGITLDIEGEKYHFNVPREKEANFRNAAELINRRYNAYRQSYQNQPQAKYHAVVMLDIAVRYLECKDNHDRLPLVEAITELNSEVEEALNISPTSTEHT